MRGQDQLSSSRFGYVDIESRVPAKHPLGLGVTPHVAQNTHDTGRARQKSAIDGRTTRHPGYAAGQRVRKRIEEVLGWIKASAGLRKTKFRSLDGGPVGFDLSQNHRENAVDMWAPAEPCGPFGRRRGTTL